MEPFQLPPDILARYPYLKHNSVNLSSGTAAWAPNAALQASVAATVLGKYQNLAQAGAGSSASSLNRVNNSKTRTAESSAAALADQHRKHMQALAEQQRQQQKRLEKKKEDDLRRREAQQFAAAGTAAGLSRTDAAAAIEEQGEDDPEEGDDENEAGHTYAEYKALQIRAIYPDIVGHPDPLVETASLASIPLPKPTFRPASLQQCVTGKLLSDAQLETVVYANMKFNGPRLPDGNRAGFFLGDGAGVGKGRQIAALIKQHWHEGGQRILWVSVSNDLRQDAQRDLDDISAEDISTFPRGNENLPHARKDLPFSGVLFVTYSMLVSGLKGAKVTSSRSKGPDKSKDKDLERIDVPHDCRLGQFIRWLKLCPQGPLIIFDECHKAKNLLPTGGGKPSQTARAVVELQEQLADAKVVYSSATGASEPRNLAYMTRLGMWGFKDAKEMIELLSKSKLGALELAAMSMKATGSYISRTLSYEGAEFALAYVDVDPIFKIMYDRATQFWHLLWKVIEPLQLSGRANSQFWAAHQRFFKQMLMAAKVPACAKLAKQAIADGMCVVVGLQSTGEANTNALMDQDEELNDLVSAPRMVLDQYIRNHFPVTKGKESVVELEGIECQVWDAIQSWKSMTPAEQVVAAGEQGIAAEREADVLRMGMAVNAQERLPEEVRIQKRLAMRVAQQKAEEEALEQQRQKRQNEWYEKHWREERQLLRRKEATANVVKTIESDLDSIMKQVAEAASGAKPSADVILLEDSSDEDSPPLNRAKRQVLDDSDSDVAPTAKKQKKLQQVIDSFFVLVSDDEEEGLEAKQNTFEGKVLHLDLTLDDEDEIVCELCGHDDDAETLLMCHHCEAGAHLACLKLQRLPKGPWFCKRCKEKSPLCKSQADHHKVAATQGIAIESIGVHEVQLSVKHVSQLQIPAKLKLPKLQAERKLALAKQKLQEVEQELLELREKIKEGPKATPAKTQRRPLSTRGVNHEGASCDPTVRMLSIKDSRIDGYRYAVKGRALDDLERSMDLDFKGMPLVSEKRSHLKTTKADDSDDDVVSIPDYIEPEDLCDDSDDEKPSKELMRIKGWLQRLVSAMELPANPLDQLTELLGGESNVAELTGRKGAVSMDGENKASYKLRAADCPQKEVNLREKDAFMSGRKLVAIISDAASTGISLQADRRKGNRRRRCHITLELPWSADKAIQQFGRSHRANQVCAPLYRILVTPCGGEFRFASAAAKRLQSLGALLRGDRKAIGAGSELKSFDIDNAQGEKALDRVLRDICAEEREAMPGIKVPHVPEHLITPEMMSYGAMKDHCSIEDVPSFYRYMRTMLAGVGLVDTVQNSNGYYVSMPRGKAKVPKFLNRLLGLNMDCQELLFQYYQDTMDATIAQLKSEGKFEQGIVTIKGQSCSIISKRVVSRDKTSGGEVEHAILAIDRGVPWEAATAFRDSVMEKLEEIEPNRRHRSGFYQQQGYQVMAGGKRRPYIVLATEVIKSASNLRNTRLHIQRPNVGPQGYLTVQELEAKGYTRMSEPKAQELWEFWYNYAHGHCYHGDNCATRRRGSNCVIGMRQQELHLLCGALLPVFKRLEDLHQGSHFGKPIKTKDGGVKRQPLRVVKCITSDGQPVVGLEMNGREEASFMEKNLNLDPAEEQAAAAARLLGQIDLSYGTLGSNTSHGMYHPYKRKRGKAASRQPKHFR